MNDDDETKIIPAIASMDEAFDCKVVNKTEPGKQYVPLDDGTFIEIVQTKTAKQLKGMVFTGEAVYATPLKAPPGKPGFWISIVADSNGLPTEAGSIVVADGDGYVPPVEDVK